jgi:hypothetical protein
MACVASLQVPVVRGNSLGANLRIEPNLRFTVGFTQFDGQLLSKTIWF